MHDSHGSKLCFGRCLDIPEIADLSNPLPYQVSNNLPTKGLSDSDFVSQFNRLDIFRLSPQKTARLSAVRGERDYSRHLVVETVRNWRRTSRTFQPQKSEED
jgi:hypothetical protein